jgi:O-antigen ligase
MMPQGTFEHSRLNDVLGWGLIVVVGATAIPLGGNRPFVWAAVGVALGLIALIYLIAGRTRRGARLPEMLPEGWLFAGLLVLAGVQLLPITGFLPPALLGPVAPEGWTSISLTPGDSILSILTFASFGLLFALLSIAGANRERAGLMLAGLFWIAVAQGVYGLVNLLLLGDTILGAAKVQYQGFATGSFVNRNSFATYVAAAIPMGIALMVARQVPRTGRHGGRLDSLAANLLPAMGVVFLVAALMASGSRAGIIVGAGGALLAVLLCVLALRVSARTLGLIGLAAVAVAVVLIGAFGTPLLARLVDPGDDFSVRLTLYRQVLEAIGQRPLLGYGGGSFATVFPIHEKPPLPGELIWANAHSTYLSLWFEYGLVVGSLPMLVVAGLWLRCLVAVLRGPFNAVIVAATAAVPVFAVHSLVDFSLEIHANALTMTALLALGVAQAVGSGTTHSPRRRAAEA